MKKLAELLLRRKELQQKLDRMGAIRQKDLYEIRVDRVKLGEGINYEDLRSAVPKMSYSDFDAEYSHYARQLRLVDGAIQNCNWTTEVDGMDECFKDFVHKD